MSRKYPFHMCPRLLVSPVFLSSMRLLCLDRSLKRAKSLSAYDALKACFVTLTLWQSTLSHAFLYFFFFHFHWQVSLLLTILHLTHAYTCPWLHPSPFSVFSLSMGLCPIHLPPLCAIHSPLTHHSITLQMIYCVTWSYIQKVLMKLCCWSACTYMHMWSAMAVLSAPTHMHQLMHILVFSL